MLAIDSGGLLYSWGSNQYGQLGRDIVTVESSTKSLNFIPQKVEKLKPYKVCGISAGNKYLTNFLSLFMNTNDNKL